MENKRSEKSTSNNTLDQNTLLLMEKISSFQASSNSKKTNQWHENTHPNYQCCDELRNSIDHISVYFWVIIGRISDELVTNIEFIRIFNKSFSFMAPFSKVVFLVSILLLALIPNQIHPNSYSLFSVFGQKTL